jgi:hypothetical protein
MSSNSLLEDFHSVLSTRYPIDGADMSMSDWICANTHIGGQQFSLAGYEFQREIADDLHPNMAVKKCSQVGLTEIQIRKFLGLLKRNRGRTGIFTLPSEKIFRRISKMRIKPLIEGEAVFNLRMANDGAKPTRSMDMYQIDESFAVISGLTEDDATSTSADFLFHDEVDLSDQEMLSLTQSRLQNSDWKITQGFSTPTWPGYGIDAQYQLSDQHEYFLKCGACNHQQVPHFEMSFLHLPGYRGEINLLEASDEQIHQINFAEAYIKCKKCSKPLDLRDPSLRQWVCKHPGRLIRGYNVRPFSTHRLPLDYIFTRLMKARRMGGIGGFINTVLGDPHVDSKAQLSEAEIRKTLKGAGEPEVSNETPCAIGIDVGDTCHITLGSIVDDQTDVFLMRSCPASRLLDTLKVLDARYNIITGLIDRHPYTPTANAVRDMFNNRILPAEYRGTSAVRLIQNELEDVTHCQLNRTDALDKVVDTIRSGKMTLQGYGPYETVVIEHLRNMVREEKPEEPAKWVKLNIEDHFFHALAFMLSAPRVHEMMYDHVAPRMLTSVGFFGFDLGGEATHPNYTPNPVQPLSARARMKGSAPLWL